MLQAMERELGRPLAEPEEHLALEQARALGMVRQCGPNPRASRFCAEAPAFDDERVV